MLVPEKINVLITAIGGGGFGEQMLKALRLAKNPEKYRIIGADMQENCPQFSLVDEKEVLPSANHKDYMEILLDRCKKHDVQALLVGCEPELRKVSAHRNDIIAQNIFLPINPQSVIETCMDKVKTNQALTNMGFVPPRFAEISGHEDVDQIDWYPVVLKPSVGAGGSANVYIAQNKQELTALLTYMRNETSNGKFLIQEYVGTPDEEYTIGVLNDMDGNYINAIAVRRYLLGQLNVRASTINRTGNPQFGEKLVISSGISHGQIGRFPKVTEQCVEIAKQIGATGAINIQGRLVNGKIRVFEINPRFSGTTSIRAMMGYNEPDILIRKHLLNEDIETDFAYEEGVVLRGLTEYRVQ